MCQYSFCILFVLKVKTIAKVASPNRSTYIPRNTIVHKENFLFSQKIIHESQEKGILLHNSFFHFLRIDCLFGLNKIKLQNKGFFEIFKHDGLMHK